MNIKLCTMWKWQTYYLNNLLHFWFVTDYIRFFLWEYYNFLSFFFFPLHLIILLQSNQNLLGIINLHEDISKVTSRNYRVSSPLWCLHSAATTTITQGIRWRQEQQPQPKPCAHSHLWVITNFTCSTWLARPPHHSAQSQQSVQRELHCCRELGNKALAPCEIWVTWGVIAEVQRGHCPALLSTGKDLHFFTHKTQKWSSGNFVRLCIGSYGICTSPKTSQKWWF